MATVRISEARLNDFCYMLLKKTYFEPVYGTGPREADIRICMDMSAPERITSITQAILLPNEVAGKSHTTMYDVDLGHVYDVTIEYLTDHWRVRWPEGAIEGNKRIWLEELVPTMMGMPEEECGG